MSSSLRFSSVSYGYGVAPVLAGVSLDLPDGGCAALIGANGAGKTTLLQLAAGTHRPWQGKVELAGVDLATLSAARRARRIALVPQALAIPFAFSVRELVALGRTPYLRSFGGERDADHLAVARALAATETTHFADRCVLDLSAGERQRVILALALAQEPEVLLLDEPTANLDLTHQQAALELIRELNRTTGLTVLAAIHDLNLAALYFDRIIALANGDVIADGTPRAVLTSEIIGEVYGSSVVVLDHPSEPAPLVALTRRAPIR